jgi:hypothetical protein
MFDWERTMDENEPWYDDGSWTRAKTYLELDVRTSTSGYYDIGSQGEVRGSRWVCARSVRWIATSPCEETGMNGGLSDEGWQDSRENRAEKGAAARRRGRMRAFTCRWRG